jgi:hypothetical protein
MMTGMKPLFRAVLVSLAIVQWAAWCSAATAGNLTAIWVDQQGKTLAEIQLQLEDLDSASQYEIYTSTPWNKEPRRFTGPSLREISELTGHSPSRATLKALNDYTVNVPREDWLTYEVILSTRIDGKQPRVYEKGPYWLIYNVDKMMKPLPQRFTARMIWQVDRLMFHVD